MAFSFSDIFGDSGKTFFDAIQNFAVQSNHFLTDSFAQSDVGDSWWAAVVGTPSSQGMLATWMTVLAPIIVLLVAIQVVISLFRGSSIGLARAFVGGWLGIPGTYVMVWIVQTATAASDEIAGFIMKQGEDQTMAAFMKIFGVQITDDKLTGLNKSYWMWDGVMDKAGGWVLLVPLLLMFLIWVLSLVLSFVMSLRAMGLVVLASLAGWAVVSMTLEMTKSWFGRWLSMVVGLLLAKPLAAGLLVLSATVFNYSAAGSQFAAGLAGLVLAIVMPFAAVGLFAFTPAGQVGGVDKAMGQGASAPVRGAARGASALTRLRRK